MSKLHERKEKSCLNCQTEIIGHYCHQCGQHNTEPKESFLHLLQHFFEDLTHFDGKFFSTLKPLFIRPGFLSQEYMSGRRASYINPIRMYLFISAMFFLLLMTFFVKSGATQEHAPKEPSRIKAGFDQLSVIIDSIPGDTEPVAVVNGKPIYEEDYTSLASYDSLQGLLPTEKKDGAIETYFARKLMGAIDYAKENPEEGKHRVMEKFFHSLPYMLFVTLPFIALLLQLLYRRRKEYYYVSHIIFTLHLYCFLFLLFAFSLIIKQFGEWGSTAAFWLRLSAFVYLYLAMIRFYKQHLGKTFAKFLILIVVGGSVVGILTLLVIVNTLINLGS